MEESNHVGDLPAFVYEMKRGYVFVIHNVEFVNRPDPIRYGSKKDVEGLRELFENKLKFRMKIESNLSASRIISEAREISEKDFTSYDCLFFVILSHGKQEGILGVDDKPVSLAAITDMFTADKCQSLKGKPKVFIVQACRGDKDDFGAVVRDADQGPPRTAALQRTPVESDFLVCYACPLGYSSYRDEEQGSWYIRELVRIFKKYDKDHLMDLMLLVNFAVSQKFCEQGFKQIPSEECRLTKKCYFSKRD